MSLLEELTRGQVAKDVRLAAARGAVQAQASELLSILVLLAGDDDEEIRTTAAATLGRLPLESTQAFLSMADVSDEVRSYFAPPPAAVPSPADLSVPTDPSSALDPDLEEEGKLDGQRIVQRLSSMSFPERLKAASKGSREVRAILIRDPSKMIALAVLSNPKLNEPEIAGFARMGNVSDEVLRTIGANRGWMKNYGVVLSLTKNSKTPLAISLNLMQRLNDRDVAMLSTDRNVPEPLRIAARKKTQAATSR